MFDKVLYEFWNPVRITYGQGTGNGEQGDDAGGASSEHSTGILDGLSPPVFGCVGTLQQNFGKRAEVFHNERTGRKNGMNTLIR